MTTATERLRKYGIRPVKALGQSFLVDGNMIRRIADLCVPGREGAMVEIGSGLGILTELLAAGATRVVAVDVDPRMTLILRKELASLGNVEILEEDILRVDLAALRERLRKEEGVTGKLRVVGNIPYNLSSPIFFHLVRHHRHLSEALLMFQKEVADRLAASPGTKTYGILSVFARAYAEPVRELEVPSSCFYPVPKVHSAVVRLTFREDPLIPIPDEAFFRQVVRKAFSQRRKTLLNNFRDLGAGTPVSDLFARAGLDGKRRGETLTVEEFGCLAAVLWEARLNGEGWQASERIDQE